MSNHQAAISKDSDGSFYALIVRIERDGYKTVIHHYKGRHFKTEAAAVRSTSNYLAKFC
ncbi:hypothetical protein N2382_09310 [SAR92 clade bacterium H921]|jgi:hypothetical protein|nr:hypothetical protein [SAR92 clade bacterium H921]